MSSPGLDHDERSIMSQKCKASSDDYDPIDGTLHLTDLDRLVFVTSNGTFRKSYSKVHYYGLASVNTVRVDSGLLGLIGMGKTLVVEWRHKEKDNEYRYQGLDAEKWCDTILKQMEHTKENIRLGKVLIKKIKSRERISFDEILLIMKDTSPDKKTGISETIDFKLQNGKALDEKEKQETDQFIIDLLEEFIVSEDLEGFIDKEKRQFISMVAYQQKTEVIQYQVATNFEFGKDGTISLKCPNCGASKPQKEKSTEVKCTHCDTIYVVPKKLLDLI